MREILTRLGGAMLVSVAVACSDPAGVDPLPPPPPPPPPVVASVMLDADALSLDEGATRRLVATPRTAAGATIPGATVQWTTSDATVATVSAAGVVTAVRMGTATVRATVDGKSAQGTVTVLGNAPADLLFDVRSALGEVMTAEVHRLDLRVPGAQPARWTEVSGVSDASPSPDGARIAFVCREAHGPALCVADRDWGNFRILTSPATLLADQPSWSPDGTRIAFRGWAPGGPPGPFNPSRIWTIGADGSGLREVTAGAAGWQQSPTWSPLQPDGGHRIAYSQQGMQDGYLVGRINSVRADGSDARAETAAGAWLDDTPAWSPDGGTIVFVRNGGTVSDELWRVGVGTGAERPFLAAPLDGAQREPAWSPDGRYLAFASNHDIDPGWYTWQVYTARADGTSLERRTYGPDEKQNPAFVRR